MITNYIGLMLQGMQMTVMVWLASLLLALIVGLILGIINACCSQRLIGGAVQSYIFIFRGIPLFVQLLLVYFVLPDLFGIDIGAAQAAILALGLCSSAYVAEIVRSGIEAIPRGQWQAAYLLGLSKRQALRYVIIPQAFRIVVPTLINEAESLLKSTALVSAIGVMDMTKVAQNVVARTMDPIPMYCALAVCYLIISAGLQAVYRLSESRVQL